MNILHYLLAPVALLSALAQGPGKDVPTHDARVTAPAGQEPDAAPVPVPALLEETREVPDQHQVSIEQRVIIRIAPSRPEPRGRPLAPLAFRENYKEKKVDGCVPIASIAAIAPAEDNHLMLFLRDRTVLSAALEKSCHAEEFYSGAYVERSADGRLCPKRDRLQSRMGTHCEVARLNRLIPRD